MEQSNSSYTFKRGRRVTVVSIFSNIVIAAVKFSLGILGKSAVLVAESIDSLLDTGTSIAIYVGIKLSTSPVDESHPHGHGKIDSLIALFVGIMIGVTGIILFYQNGMKIYTQDFTRPEPIALLGVVVAIAIKVCLYFYTHKTATDLNSPSLQAASMDHKADAIRLSGVFVGISVAIVGLPILDPIAALLVSLLIMKVSVQVSYNALLDLSDQQMPEHLRVAVNDVIQMWDGQYDVVETIGRRMGSQYQVNLRVKVKPYLTAIQGSTDLRKLESHIIDSLPEIRGVDITTFVNKKKVQERELAFKSHVVKVFERHNDKYLGVEKMEFHFMENEKEIHCDLFVNPKMEVFEADQIRKTIISNICAEHEDAEVHITIKPATIH